MSRPKKGWRQPDEVREKIQAAQIINRLNTHILADKPIMDASQVSAAKVLLNKIIPDLKAVEHTGENGGPIQVLVTRFTGNDTAHNDTE